MRNRTILLLALAAALSPPAMASAQYVDPNVADCSVKSGLTAPGNWTCIAYNFQSTPGGVQNPTYLWMTARLVEWSNMTETTTGTVYFKNQYITLADAAGDLQFAVPDGSITLMAGSGAASTTYDAAGWHTTLYTGSYSLSTNVLLAAVGYQVPVGYNVSDYKNVSWEGQFFYDPGMGQIPGNDVDMKWQWHGAAYNCGSDTACQTAFGGDFDATNPQVVDGTYQPGAPTAFLGKVVQGATGGGGSNFTGSGSSSVRIYGDPLPPMTVPEPATTLLLGTGLVGFGMIARRRRNHSKK